MGRERRRTTANARAVHKPPSSAHYVGYVEDNESIEAIMKKFETVEALKQEAREAAGSRQGRDEGGAGGAGEGGAGSVAQGGEGGDEGGGEGPSSGEAGPSGIADANCEVDHEADDDVLDEALLEQVFRQTSTFRLNAVLRENAGQGRQGLYDSNALVDDGEDEFFYDSDIDDPVLLEQMKRARAAKRRRTGGGGGGSGRRSPSPGAQGATARDRMVSMYRAGLRATMRARMTDQSIDPLLPTFIKVPPRDKETGAFPIQWGHDILPYEPPLSLEQRAAKAGPSCRLIKSADIRKLSHEQLLGDKDPKEGFLAALVSAPWRVPGYTDGITVADFEALDLGKLVPRGFLFVWTEKEVMAGVLAVAMKWGFSYIENMTWWKQTVEMQDTNDPRGKPVFGRSHMTMLMFRRMDTGREIQLRHQRSSDTVRDFEAHSPRGALIKPEESYTGLEVLLPEFISPDGKTGRLLELWGTFPRRGWTTVIAEGKY